MCTELYMEMAQISEDNFREHVSGQPNSSLIAGKKETPTGTNIVNDLNAAVV